MSFGVSPTSIPWESQNCKIKYRDIFARNITWRWPLQCAGSVVLSDAATTDDVMTSRRQTQRTMMRCESIPWRNVSRRRYLACCRARTNQVSLHFLKTKWPLNLPFPSKWWHVINRKQHSCVFGVVQFSYCLQLFSWRDVIQWGTGVKTNPKGGADAQLGAICKLPRSRIWISRDLSELGEQWMWRHLRLERATASCKWPRGKSCIIPYILARTLPWYVALVEQKNYLVG
jgi:hypothetical protein